MLKCLHSEVSCFSSCNTVLTEWHKHKVSINSIGNGVNFLKTSALVLVFNTMSFSTNSNGYVQMLVDWSHGGLRVFWNNSHKVQCLTPCLVCLFVCFSVRSIKYYYMQFKNNFNEYWRMEIISQGLLIGFLYWKALFPSVFHSQGPKFFEY